MAWVGRRLRHRQCIRLGGTRGTCIDRRMDVVLGTETGISSPTLISCSYTVGDVRLVRRRGFRRLYGPRDTPQACRHEQPGATTPISKCKTMEVRYCWQAGPWCGIIDPVLPVNTGER